MDQQRDHSKAPTCIQIRRLGPDPQLLAAFERLVNAKLSQWEASRQFEKRAGRTFNTIEKRLSNFCSVLEDPYEASGEDLREFLEGLVSEEG